MTKRTARISLPPKTIIGHRKDGRPIFNIAGGADGDEPTELITIPVPPPAPVPTPPATFTEADIRAAKEEARKEEKDKLYGRLNKFEEQTKVLEQEIAAQRKAREDAEAAESAKRAAVEAEIAKKAEEELSLRDLLEKKEAEWDLKFKSVEQDRDNERVMLAKEKEFLSLQNYAQQAVQAALQNNEIAPELANFVSGNTPEEINASLNSVKDASKAILASVKEAASTARSNMTGVSPTGYASTGPMDNESTYQTLSPADIQAMSMSDWAKIRGSLVGKSSNNQGLYS